MMLIDVHSGAGPPPRPPRGAVIAVVDVLRASTTIVAALCLDLFHEHRDRLALALRRTTHGRRLLALGLGRDVAAAARLNSIPLTPVLRGNALTSSRLVPA